ncbi:hypothetical protein BJV82DRAFT_590362 [Fennellomyces sp. T-0311]|nr:hypothetical protein BJV82DRAFT_590362 [Fennellomyces sp. T-0311]
MDSEKQQHRAMFDSTVYAAVHPLHDTSLRRPSPSLPSSDSLSQTSQSSHRDEEESGLCSVFDKLKTEERRNSSPGHKHSDDIVKTAQHRSMSVDVGSVHHHHKLPSSASSSSTTRGSSGSGSNVPTSTSIQDLLSKNLLFDGDPHKQGTLSRKKK